MERTARIKLVYESDKRKRSVGVTQIVIGVLVVLLSIGFFSTAGTDARSSLALGTLALLTGVFMIMTGRATLMV